MWTSTIDLDFKKVLLAQLIGRFYRNIYFSSYSPLQVQNLPRQSLPKTSWVRVRNHLSGISGSDLHLLYGDGDLRTAPAAIPAHKYLYPGHEMVGEVIEIGDDVQHLHVGDRVVLQNGPNCLSAGILPPCRFCMAGNYNLCENIALSPRPIGGGWSEEMLVHEQQLFQLPTTLTDEQAVMLEPTSVALHAVLRRLPRHGERVLIIGAGSIGLALLQIVRALAPQSEVSVLARHAFQVERATRIGAAHIIYPRDAYVGVKRATQAKLYQGTLGNQTLSGGYDVIFDTVGRRKTLHNALRWTRAQGTIILVGINLHMMNLDLTPIWYQEINLLGSTSHGMEHWPIDSGEYRSTFSAATELMEQGRIAPEQLITHHFALNNYKHALLTTRNKAESRAIKVVFDYSLLPASVVPNVRASAPRRRPVTVNFDIDYPIHEQEGAENGSQKQEESEEPKQVPVSESMTYTSVPYTASIQDTPPIRPYTKEMPPFFTSSARSRHEQDDDEAEESGDSEDTASALPVVGRHIYTPNQLDFNHPSPTLAAYAPEQDKPNEPLPLELHTPHPQYTASPDQPTIPELHTPEHPELPEHVAARSLPSTSNTTSRGTDLSRIDQLQPENHLPTFPITPNAPSEDLQDQHDEATFPHQPASQNEEFAATSPEIEPQLLAEDLTPVDPDLSVENKDEHVDEKPLEEQSVSEVTPAEVIAAELDPQTLEPDEEPWPAQRSRPSHRKRKQNGR